MPTYNFSTLNVPQQSSPAPTTAVRINDSDQVVGYWSPITFRDQRRRIYVQRRKLHTSKRPVRINGHRRAPNRGIRYKWIPAKLSVFIRAPMGRSMAAALGVTEIQFLSGTAPIGGGVVAT